MDQIRTYYPLILIICCRKNEFSQNVCTFTHYIHDSYILDLFIFLFLNKNSFEISIVCVQIVGEHGSLSSHDCVATSVDIAIMIALLKANAFCGLACALVK